MKKLSCFLGLLLAASAASARVYSVGEGFPLKTPDDVPWESLYPGDVVEIHWRLLPYRSKWVMCAQGRKELPITVRGVPSADGLLPIIDGRNATTRDQLNFWGEERAVIKIGGANKPVDTMPSHIVIESLDIRGARRGNVFTGRTGSGEYRPNAAAIYIEKGRGITLRDCVFHDCGNGLITSSDCEELLIQRCHFYGNGNVDSIYEHNSYTSSRGIVYEFCRFGPLLEGAGGNNLKDRSAGLVVRYNWIEGGTRMLDLVDADHRLTVGDDRYHATHVYGNVLIKDDVSSNHQIVHFGGDSGKKQNYRNGLLYFYNNTVVSRRTKNSTLFRLSSGGQSVYMANNLVYLTALGNRLEVVTGEGPVYGYRNWFKEGWKMSRSKFNPSSSLTDTLSGEKPGFNDPENDDYRLAEGSECLGSGAYLKGDLVPDHAVRFHYFPGGDGVPRSRNGQPNHERPDIGAYEVAAPRD